MIVDMESGEIMFDRFAKMFFEDVEKLFRMTPTQIGVFMLMVKTVKIGNENRIEMHPERKKKFAESLGITTTNSISNILRALEMMDAIKRENKHSNNFTINPSLFFKGNDFQHAKLLMSYSEGKRSIKAFASKAELEKYLDSGEYNLGVFTEGETASSEEDDELSA